MRLSTKPPAPTALALDWATQIKGHLRLDSDEERARIESVCVPAAMADVEAVSGRQLITTTYYGYLDAFPDGRVITLPKAPLQSVISVKYIDGDGVLQTLAATYYTVDAPAGPKCSIGRIILDYGEIWPTTRDDPNAVTVEFIAGYGLTYSSIPGGLAAAMLHHVAEQFERREDSVVGVSITKAPTGWLTLALPYLSEG